MSLRLRLALFGAAVVALALVLFGLALYGLFARGVNTNQDDALRTRARAAATSLGSTSAIGLTPVPPVAPADLRTSTEVFVEVLGPDGTPTYSTAELNGAPPAVSPGLLTH